MAKTPANGAASGGNSNNSTWPGVLIALIGALGTAYAVYRQPVTPPTPTPTPAKTQAAVQSPATTTPTTGQGAQTPPKVGATRRHKPPIKAGTDAANTGQGVGTTQGPAPGNSGGTPPPPPPPPPPAQSFPTLVLTQFDADHDGFVGHTEWRFVISVNGVEVGQIAQMNFHNLPHHGTVNGAGWVSWKNVRLKGDSPYKIDVQAYRPNEDTPRPSEHGLGTIQGLNGATAVHIKGGGVLAPYDFTLTFTVVSAP